MNNISKLALAASAALAISWPIVAQASVSNPDTSVNFLTLYENHSHAAPGDGFNLQEVEMQFMSDVDPYWRANALLSVSKDKGGGYGIDPEEVFAETIFIPSLTLRVGKFKAAAGKHNQLHTHAYPFIDAPLVNGILLGDEGLNEAGVSAAYLIPTGWYSELTVQALKGDSPTLFGSAAPGDMIVNNHWKNLLDVSDSLTAEIGFTGAFGRNSTNANTTLLGADLTFKFRPVEGGKYQSLIWATEYLRANRNGFAGATTATGFENLDKVDGLASWLLYQFAERWSAGARYDLVGLTQHGNFDRQNRASAILAFNFSEFSQIRAQYDYTKQGSSPVGHHVALQMNFTIGVHPAHSY